MNRPTETLTAALSAVVAAALVLLEAFYPELAAKITAEVSAAIMLLLGYAATIVTYFVTRRLRSGTSPLQSTADGSITTEPTP